MRYQSRARLTVIYVDEFTGGGNLGKIHLGAGKLLASFHSLERGEKKLT